MSSGAKSHKTQSQVVEGSAVGEYYITTKVDYQSGINPIFVGECKSGTGDNVNRHFIKKFNYLSGMLLNVTTATRETTLGCTNIDLNVMTPSVVNITLNNGDASEVNIGDGFILKSGLYHINGTILRKNSDTNFMVTILGSTASIVPISNLSVLENELLCNLRHDSTEDYTKRRWDHRNRYIYV